MKTIVASELRRYCITPEEVNIREKGGALAGALATVLSLILAPGDFQFSVVFGAVGVILPFLAGYMPRHLESVYMAAVGLLAVAITGTLEFLLTGAIAESTRSLALSVLVAYLARPVGPEDPAPR